MSKRTLFLNVISASLQVRTPLPVHHGAGWRCPSKKRKVEEGFLPACGDKTDWAIGWMMERRSWSWLATGSLLALWLVRRAPAACVVIRATLGYVQEHAVASQFNFSMGVAVLCSYLLSGLMTNHCFGLLLKCVKYYRGIFMFSSAIFKWMLSNYLLVWNFLLQQISASLQRSKSIFTSARFLSS